LSASNLSIQIRRDNRFFLESIPALIEKTFPIPGRFRAKLPFHVAELSRLLTSERGDRSLSYLSRPNFLSAYLRYFFPWNLCRLCLLLPSLDIALSCGDSITDIGSGPLTFVSALWISRPELRDTPLEFYCIDRSSPALEAGRKFFDALTGGSPWKINLIRGTVDARAKAGLIRKGKQSALVCAVNVFNELCEDLPYSDTEGLRRTAAAAARVMHSYAAPSAFILTVEPGVPRSGQFISLLRSAFMELNRPPLSPCPHIGACPFPGGKKRWCHFAFETGAAPKELLRLSAAAGIPKERLVLSYLLAGPVSGNYSVHASNTTRIISDAFPLPNNRFGRYCCSERGLVLLTGEKSAIEKIISGSMVTPVFAADKQRDAKSGAIITEVK
jgi:ribosomal protein RSM22 (predicted rRNA methylase)